ALDMEASMGGLMSELLESWGATIDGKQFRFAGSYYNDLTGESIPCEIQTGGRFTELDLGSAKAGDNTNNH
ncbi:MULTISPECIES: phage major tail tube protein, partial [unclassified Providencia]